MSEARRTAEALEAARENTRTATLAAGQYRHRSMLEQQVTDMAELVQAMETLHGITADLATVAKSWADTIREHYWPGQTPGESWPEPLKEAASDADRALTKLRSHLARTPARTGHDTLSVLHGFLRDVQRAGARRTA